VANRSPGWYDPSMITFALCALLAAQPGETNAPIKFDTITLKDAEQLDGQPVTITFLPACPAYTWGEDKRRVTIAGPAPAGSFERTVMLKGNRLRDADLGCGKLTVHGTRRVIRHPGAVIGNTAFAPFTEVRLEE
jgi:hypothetical protein